MLRSHSAGNWAAHPRAVHERDPSPAQHNSWRNIEGDMLRATYPHVAGFPDRRVLRPAPTAARPPSHFPGSPVIGQASLPAAHSGGVSRLSRVPTMTVRAFNAHYAGGFLSADSWNQNAFHGLRRHETGSAPLLPSGRTGPLDDAYSGFTHVADLRIASTPLRTRPLDHARGHRYQGPRRLPGPDSHRQAIVNLSLLRHVDLHFLIAPEQSRRAS